jgi:hypothetical protein
MTEPAAQPPSIAAPESRAPEASRPAPISPSDRTTRSRSQRAQIGSIVAVVVSVVALGLNLYQTRLLQTQLHSGVWPYLSISYPLSYSEHDSDFRFTISNDGVGPAIVKSVRVTLDGRPMQRWEDVFDALFGDHHKISSYLGTVHDQVIPSGVNRDTRIEAVRLVDREAGRGMHEAGGTRLIMEICYCSVYDDCWVVRADKHGAVASCQPAGPDEFQQ